MVEKWSDSQSIPGDKLSFVCIPDCKGKLPIKLFQTIGPILLIGMNDNLGIRFCVKAWPLASKRERSSTKL